jgi:hypothetical protein
MSAGAYWALILSIGKLRLSRLLLAGITHLANREVNCRVAVILMNNNQPLGIVARSAATQLSLTCMHCICLSIIMLAAVAVIILLSLPPLPHCCGRSRGHRHCRRQLTMVAVVSSATSLLSPRPSSSPTSSSWFVVEVALHLC